jgi:hypothetical protein
MITSSAANADQIAQFSASANSRQPPLAPDSSITNAGITSTAASSIGHSKARAIRAERASIPASLV